jgi:hypothetical protein
MRGVKTILNSLEAALLVAERIYREVPKGEYWYDKDFGPKDEDDLEGI